MSWWEEQTNHISESPFVVGFVVAIITSLLSTSRKHPRMKFMARITEALTCSILSLGLTKLAVFYFDFAGEEEMAIPIGVFVAWIGTSSLKEALNKIFEKWLGKLTSEK